MPLVFGILLTGFLSQAAELEYVSNDELASELTNRQADIARTKDRLASLQNKTLFAKQEFNRAEKEARQAENLLTTRARMFYKLHKNGGTLRYLLGSSSAMQLLKRLSELKHLLEDGLQSHRHANIRLVEATNRVETIKREISAANTMLSMLKQARNELSDELAKRQPSGNRVLSANKRRGIKLRANSNPKTALRLVSSK